ncbi:MAG: hypothetical protein K2X32_14430 [Phycisphaerales bacterium]|nr:hypothetical protein [Phycisphaerales bacterium]
MITARPAVNFPMFSLIAACAMGVVTGVTAPAAANTVYNEAITGDLSGNRLAPTNLGVLTPGSNTLLGSTGNADRDYFRITIAPTQSLTNINLVSYVSNDRAAFIGVQAGSTFTEDPNAADVANILGYTLIGPNGAPAGSDILDNMGVGGGAIGFTGALGAGTYTFWLQQLGANTTYTLDFVVVPTPSAAALLGLGVLSVSRRRRR